MQLALTTIHELGASLIAITPELPDNALSLVEKEQLEFEVLSDTGNQVAREFGIVYALPEEMRTIYHRFGIDIPKSNGDGTYELPLPATYVLDREGFIKWYFADADHTKRAEPEDVISVLRNVVG